MDDHVTHLTREGYRKFEGELNYLRSIRRVEVAERLRIALEEGGDLVENAEYEDAKNEQAFVEGRIQQLELLLNRAQIIEDEENFAPDNPDVVRLNSFVKLQEGRRTPEIYHLVGSMEADPTQGKISDASPLGRALMGKRVGDTVTISAPDGSFTYKIISVDH